MTIDGMVDMIEGEMRYQLERAKQQIALVQFHHHVPAGITTLASTTFTIGASLST
jgi:hypothetical protein